MGGLLLISVVSSIDFRCSLFDSMVLPEINLHMQATTDLKQKDSTVELGVDVRGETEVRRDDGKGKTQGQGTKTGSVGNY